MEECARCVYLFGDQTGDFDAGLRHLFEAKCNFLLASFFEKCYHAIRQEITRLPPSQQRSIPRFASVVDLLARYRESGPNPALENALTCIYQLGWFINYHGYHGYVYPSSPDSCVIGLCTGLLCAAAVSSSRSIGELIPVAAETVVVALRLGLCVAGVRDIVAPREQTSSSWCVLLSGIRELEARNILDKFSFQWGISPSSRPYISAVGSNGLTISAPSMLLDQFIGACISDDYKPARAPINGPYHAAHLYDYRDVERILEHWPRDAYLSYKPRIPILSSNTGNPLEAETFDSLLRACVEEILSRQLRWDKIIDSYLSMAYGANPSRCKLFSNSTAAARSLCLALKRGGIPCVDLESGAVDIPRDPSSIGFTGRAEHSKIAIIGLGSRFPDAPNPEKFWDILHRGLDVHREVPPDRWDVGAHVDTTGSRKNTGKTPYGCWISEPGLFDPRFFNMSPREALQTDPAQRLTLLTAYEALEMAGFVPDSTPSTQRNRVGIFFGMTSDDYREVNSGQDIDTYFITGGNRAFTPGRINYYFKFSGPSVSVDTACSSSLAAIHMACNSIWKNDCDTAIAGGVNVLTNPDNHAGLDRGHFLSRTGNCNTFDDEADGYCRADGVGAVVLKRLEDAQADNDPIQGVIAGAYTNHSAESISMTRPHVGAQACIFDKLLNEANVDAKEVNYIEMHGTGTQAGDAVEMQSVLDTFAPDYCRGPGQSLHLGSAKSNVGHGESASGVTSLVKVLLMMQKNVIPPHCGIKTSINHNFPTDLQQRNVHIAFEPTPWDRPQPGKRKAFLNNFSAAGGNTALLLEDAPLPKTEPTHDPRTVHTVVISAKSQAALRNNINALLAYIGENDKSSKGSQFNLLASLSYTTTARRIHYPFRAAAVGFCLSEIRDVLTAVSRSESTTPVPTTVSRAAFLFTGQGAQYTGMGKQLYECCSQFRATIHHLNCISQNLGFPSITSFVDGSVPIEDLCPVVTQLGTTCVQIALSNYWISLGLRPAFVLGHSLGEYAAMNAAGLLTACDAVYLCGSRAQLLAEQCHVGTHSMLAVKASVVQVEPFLEGKPTDVACINAPTETVISGVNATIDELSLRLSEQGLQSTKLNVPFAFHSAQVEPIVGTFGQVAQGVTFHRPSVPFVSALLGEVITESNFDILGSSYLPRHCRETVNFLGALEAIEYGGLVNDRTLWVEIGSHPVCSGMVKATFGPQATTAASLRRDEDTWKVLCTSLATLYTAGIDINWKEYQQDFVASHQVLQLPSYSWDLKNYWIPYSNNFCLTKGDSCVPEAEPASPSTFLTTSAQNIIETRNDGETATVVVQNNISDPDLRPVIRGHKVNGIALCPSSLYADIAQTLSEYLVEKYKPELKGVGFDVCDVTVSKPLVARDSDEQLFRVSAVANWADQNASIKVFSVDSEGRKTTDHASCLVKFFDCKSAWLEWKRIAYLVQRSIDRLQESADKGESHRIKRGMVYKLFRTLVDYDDTYKSIEEVILDSDQNEATALVRFQAPRGNFHRNPFWIDSFGHLSGFVMNASDTIDSRDQVYINHGWDSMRCLKKFFPDVTYRTYVRMQPWQNSLWAGDVYIFGDEGIVAVFGGVKFQQLPRKILDTVLPQSGSPKASKPARPAPLQINERKANLGAAKETHPRSPIAAAKPSVTSRVLEILAQEVGLDESEMTDDLVLADCGVGSLLSLTVTGRFREELGLDLESSVFIENPTILGLKRCLSEVSPSYSSDRSSSFSSMGTSTDISSAGSFGCLSSPAKEVLVEQDVSMKEIRLIIADEIGLPSADMTGEESLGELGMDSLLSLTVLGRIRETLGIGLPSDFFLENRTLNDIERALDLKPEPAKDPEPTPTSESKNSPPATSVLLQGNSKTATKTLFLFPDGSGSAMSYATLPAISPGICVYGLNCPYVKTPEDLTCSLDKLTAPYIAEIRRRQPRGPYNLGGWSAGGISAYDAARCLVTKENEPVDRLLLLDTPLPIGLEKVPPWLYDFFSSIGLFSDGKPPPKWLLPHFLAFIDSLGAYRPSPFPSSSSNPRPDSNPGPKTKTPKTYLIWAKDGVCNKPDDPRPPPAPDGSKDSKEMAWLLNDRVDLGPNGWETLVGEENIARVAVLEGANHFSMMRGEKGKEVAGLLGRCMAGYG